MAFESLSEKYEFRIANFPEEWLPLIYLYDPDLPLFPLLYFHCIDPELTANNRPSETDRVFGFVHHLNLIEGNLDVTVALNKDLTKPQNDRYRKVVEDAVHERLGLSDPIRLDDLRNSFSGKLAAANKLIEELWYQIVDRSFGKSLPFGSIWDPVFGLGRFIASWYSQSGRKGELIQAHYFATAFGERIQTGGGIHVDFYLLPTFSEFIDLTNPLNRFPKFAELVSAAVEFTTKYCSVVSLGNHKFSKFNILSTKAGSKLDTNIVIEIINRESGKRRDALYENFAAFGRGPQRSLMALMMFSDLRRSFWRPDKFSSADCAAMYDGLGGTYQSSKVIQLYAQQCFGAVGVLPIDNWVSTFVRWPFGFKPSKKSKYYGELFACAPNWGKIERLVWLAAQARKVHSSICAEILWCIRYGASEKALRGANPLSCKICMSHIREVCPAYAVIAAVPVAFNEPGKTLGGFVIRTSASDNKTQSQTIVSCARAGSDERDDYSTHDRPNQFRPYPIPSHQGEEMSVADFIKRY